MNEFAAVMRDVFNLLDTPFRLYRYQISFFGIVVFSLSAGLIGFLVRRLFDIE